MNHAELRAAMIQRFDRCAELFAQRPSCEQLTMLVDNALAMMPDRAGEFPVGTVDESGRLVTYERRFTVRVAVPHGEKADGYQRARVDVDLDGYMLNSLKVDSNTEAIVNANAEIVQQLIADAATFGIDQPEIEVDPISRVRPLPSEDAAIVVDSVVALRQTGNAHLDSLGRSVELGLAPYEQGSDATGRARGPVWRSPMTAIVLEVRDVQLDWTNVPELGGYATHRHCRVRVADGIEGWISAGCMSVIAESPASPEV